MREGKKIYHITIRAWRSGCGFARLTTHNQCPDLDTEQAITQNPLLCAVKFRKMETIIYDGDNYNLEKISGNSENISLGTKDKLLFTSSK